MFDLLPYTPKEIVFGYIVFMAACVLTYPIMELILKAVVRGVGRWK